MESRLGTVMVNFTPKPQDLSATLLSCPFMSLCVPPLSHSSSPHRHCPESPVQMEEGVVLVVLPECQGT